MIKFLKDQKVIQKKAIFLVAALLFTGCTSSVPKAKKPGNDTWYFLGLKSLDSGNEADARKKLIKAEKKGSELIAQRAAQTLCTFGNIQQQVKYAEKLLTRFNTPENLLISAKCLYNGQEYSKILQLTKNIDFEKDKNELIVLRLKSLKKYNEEQFRDETFRWFMLCPITDEHVSFWEENGWLMEKDDSLGPSNLINFRIALFQKKYIELLDAAPKIEKYIYENKIFYPQLFSDYCKTFFYGDDDFTRLAPEFVKLAEKYSGTEGAFFFWFYSARMYDRLGNYANKTRISFENAISFAKTSQQKDNALWYLFDTGLKNSPSIIVDLVCENAGQIGDPFYFDDFFDSLCVHLLNAGRFEDLGKLYMALDNHASNETVAKYAYIYGRYVQENQEDSKRIYIEAFRRALKADSALYYKILAAEKLGLSDYEKQKIYFSPKTSQKFTQTEGVSELLEGYLEFGMTDRLYTEYMKHDLVDLQTTIDCAAYFKNCSRGDDDFLVQSLRMASRHAMRTDEPINMELHNLLYPKNYRENVENVCTKYGISPNSLWALIRSESFFDPDVRSYAGAVGLTQLMEFTAADVARKLKISDYDLSDPEINIELGAFYLSELIQRLDGDLLSAYFSYNAGITRVRRWKQSAQTSWKNLPEDIFLETLPFTETREYGRKLVSAQKMYEIGE